MNRFLQRRKDRVQDEGALATSGTKKAKKGKKGLPEPKIEMDLTMALPSSNEFRTSLIMPTLSSRFSMLREQDDPTSKLGKASDDSVLQPKRQSRLHEFGFVPGGLSDIAEVSSLSGSIRPPFAIERTNSFDSYATEDDSQNGSVMSRSRPGEGNVLFGGRQKIYKIATSGSAKSLGKALYEDDVSMSTFQKLRQQEKERQLRELESHANANVTEHSQPSSPVRELAYSPSVSSFNRRRETSSSTNSGSITRSSTAATSIASQGANSVPASSPALPHSSSAPSAVPQTSELNRSTTKARRLYDQGLDQHIQDQQSSAMSRLNSIQRSRAPTGRSTPPFLAQNRSATNLNDRFHRNGSIRTESPTPANNPSAFNGSQAQSANSSPVVSGAQSPPLSPLGSDTEEAQALQSALQPNDRGKATAMGAFNKPSQPFDEQQYAQRLKQMQQGRESPVPRHDRPSKPSLRERAELEQRKRAEAGMAERLRSDSSAEKQTPSAFSVFQNAANQMRTVPPESPPKPSQQIQVQPQQVRSPDSVQGTTFFASPGDSSDEESAPKPRTFKVSELDRRLDRIPTSNRPAPSILEHPALRSRANTEDGLNKNIDKEQAIQLQSSEDGRLQVDSQDKRTSVGTIVKSDETEVDSPTLGPNNGGLGGLIRQHLRNPSSVSSDYGETTPGLAPLSLRTQDVGFQRRHAASEADTPAHSSYSHSNPWDLEDLDGPYYGEADSISSTSPTDPHRPKPIAINSGTPMQNSTAGDGRASQDDNVPHWEKELRSKHQRGGSTETQQEREAFHRELAQRQRAIQESLRSKVGSESNSRSASPAPAPGSFKNALGMLRSKSSRDSFATSENIKPQEPSSKAMRMLGLGGASANASSTSLATAGDRFYGSDNWRFEEDRVGQRAPSRMRPARVLGQSEQDARRELEQRLTRATAEDSGREPRSVNGRSPPASSKSSTRNRSSSEVSSGRSRSRTGRYRDDLDRAMAEGTSSSAHVYPPNASPFPTQQSPDTQPEMPQTGRLRSGSKSTAASYFDSKSLHPIHTGNGPMLNGSSPRLSPAANSPKPGFSPGLPLSPRPSPGAPSPGLNALRPQASPVPPFAAPFSANSTPPLSAATTPVATTFSNSSSTSVKLASRKKSVNKSEISEPVFVSATSVMDTVELPAGASLKNGMEPPAPPVPPINPMRRRFGFGRSESPASDISIQPPHAPFTEAQRTNSADDLSSRQGQKRGLRKTSSEGRSLHAKAQPPVITSPALPPGTFAGVNGSPPRPVAEGGMF